MPSDICRTANSGALIICRFGREVSDLAIVFGTAAISARSGPAFLAVWIAFWTCDFSSKSYLSTQERRPNDEKKSLSHHLGRLLLPRLS
jgi:hypothetical protein